ncbi:MAG: HAMP domain-containing histidine kinase [Prevotella sp.]|nr:HAMP domain-containing histidine kinase [Prevotella sp.]
MKWIDRIRLVKIILVITAVVIAVVSLVVFHFLINDLSKEERSRMSVWAEAMHSLNAADETTDLNLVLKVINENNTIPVIVLDAEGKLQVFRNVDIKADNYVDSLKVVSSLARQWLQSGRMIKLSADKHNNSEFILVCYDESTMLKRLSMYPYVLLGVVLLFVFIAIFILLVSKRAEQNKVWVGLSKETAHQLGTPISSLMAWIEILKEQYPNDALIPEMDKDVKRLQLISERFSKIGSLPEPVPTNLKEVLEHVIEYMDRRTSHGVVFVRDFPDKDVWLKMNASLFEWVIENLCKNAVDAMSGGPGTITVRIVEEDNKICVEVSDTGKGIKKKNLSHIFRPGFTTKQRGWGLGLSLAKRIIEDYHKGKIFVKWSEVNKGTTFRVELREA